MEIWFRSRAGGGEEEGRGKEEEEEEKGKKVVTGHMISKLIVFIRLFRYHMHLNILQKSSFTT